MPSIGGGADKKWNVPMMNVDRGKAHNTIVLWVLLGELQNERVDLF